MKRIMENFRRYKEAVDPSLTDDDLNKSHGFNPPGEEESEEEFFDELLFGDEDSLAESADDDDEEEDKEKELNELGFMATAGAVALGGILGVLVWRGAGKAKNFAKNVLHHAGKKAEHRARAARGKMDRENQEFILQAFQSDQELLSMLGRFDELTQVVAKSKGQRSPELQSQRAELKKLSPAISEKLRTIQQDVGGDSPHPTRPLGNDDLQRQRRSVVREP